MRIGQKKSSHPRKQSTLKSDMWLGWYDYDWDWDWDCDWDERNRLAY